MPVRPCLTEGCRAFALDGKRYCHQHIKPYRWHQGSTRAWRTQRARILQRDGHRCTAILPDGSRCKVIEPLKVHHLDQGSELNVPDDRLITVCPRHHPKGARLG